MNGVCKWTAYFCCILTRTTRKLRSCETPLWLQSTTGQRASSWYVELWCCRCCCNYLHRNPFFSVRENAPKITESSEFRPTKENAFTPSCREPAASLESTLTVLVQVLLLWSRHWMKCPETENCCSVLHLINTIELFFDYLPKKYAYRHK